MKTIATDRHRTLLLSLVQYPRTMAIENVRNFLDVTLTETRSLLNELRDRGLLEEFSDPADYRQNKKLWYRLGDRALVNQFLQETQPEAEEAPIAAHADNLIRISDPQWESRRSEAAKARIRAKATEWDKRGVDYSLATLCRSCGLPRNYLDAHPALKAELQPRTREAKQRRLERRQQMVQAELMPVDTAYKQLSVHQQGIYRLWKTIDRWLSEGREFTHRELLKEADLPRLYFAQNPEVKAAIDNVINQHQQEQKAS